MDKNKLNIDEMVILFKLLGEETRLTILSLLKERPCCVCELVEVLKVSQPAISQHLRKLRDTKLVKEDKRGQWVYYSLNEEAEQYPLINYILDRAPQQTDLLEKIAQQVQC